MHLHEWKADRRSIGGFFGAGSFTEHTVPIHEGDAFILFTDGFADQFGGGNGKKLGSPRFRQMALEAASSDFSLLASHLDTWMVREEQVDDVTVVCFRA